MWNALCNLFDWFVPAEMKRDRSEFGMARNFVFTHFFGPALGQSICLFLLLTDRSHPVQALTICFAVWSFLALPFLLKFSRNLRLCAVLSVEILSFAALFGAYNYGGVSSPLMPWLLVALLNGFFYLSDRPLTVVAIFGFNLLAFFLAFQWRGSFPELLPLSALTVVGWISIISAMIYMSFMAIYYANMISMRSVLQREAERHRATAIRLREASEAAEKANTAKSIFLAKMSHELRTPLNAVIGYSELLLEENQDRPESATKVADLRRINSAGRHLLALVTDVLDLAKIEADSIQLAVEDIDLNALLEDVVANVQPLVAKKGNRLVIKCDDDLGMLSNDATKLRQVMLNLMSNAAKFTEKGTITLSIARERRVAGDWIEIRVADTGIGIAEENLSKLFQDFGQATAATSSVYGGTGLGLALSQRLCGMMGGGITVTSALGAGSTFTIRVPAVVPGQASDEKQAA
jgi:signal transduction histidine kinase